MARRYRYAFAKKKEAEEGNLAAVLAIVSVVLFVVDLVLNGLFAKEAYTGPVIGGLSVCGTLFSCYGFIEGMVGLRQRDRGHSVSTAAAIANAVIMVGWIGLFFIGL